jgi:hypothetical protein
MSIADKLKTVAQKMEDVYRTGLFKYAQKSTESGETILLENSAPEPFVNMKPYGHSWQNGTPTPTEPQPIESAKEVKVIGKNWYSGDDVTATRYVEVSTNPIPIGTYTISAKVETNYPNAEYYGVSILNKNDSAFYTAILNAEKDGRYYWTMELTEECYELGFYVAETDSSSTNYTTIFSDIQIELGNEATEYEPYKEQTLTLPTLHGIGDVRDYVDFERKKLVHRIQKYTCTDVTDVWRYLGDTSNRKENAFFRMQADGIKVNTELLCTHLEGIYTIWQTDKDYLGCECVEANCIDFTIPYSLLGVTYDSTSTEKEDAMRTWLQSNTLEFYGELAEPIETDLTDDEIYAFKRLRANSPTTTIVGQGQVDVTYIVDNRQ